MESNPNFPKVIGAELTPRTNFQRPKLVPVGGGGDAVIETFLSTATQTVDSMALWLANVAPLTTDPYVATEIVTAGQEVATTRNTTAYPPNASSQTDIVGTWANVVDGSSFINNTIATTGIINLDFATAGLLTGKRICNIRFEVEVSASVANGRAMLLAEFDGFTAWAPVTLISSGSDSDVAFLDWVKVVFDSGEIDPRVFPPEMWTPTKFQALDSGADRFTLYLNANGDLNCTCYVRKISVVVDYADENRLNQNFVQPFTSGNDDPVWVPYTPKKVSLAANFAKVNATSYSRITRAMRVGNLIDFTGYNGAAAMLVVPMMTDAPPAFPGLRLAPTMNTDGTVAVLGPTTEDAFTPLDMLIAGVMSVDAQPWAFPDDGNGNVWATLQQEFTQSSGGPITVTGARLVGKYQPDANGNVANLTVALKRRSDNAVMATGTVTRADVDAAPDGADIGYEGYSLIQMAFVAGFAMVSGTQYYLDLTSTAKDDWVFPVLRVSNISAGGAQSWHGATDAGTYNSEQSYYDFPWLLFQAIAAPGAFAAVGQSQPVEVAADLCDGILHDDCLVYAIGLVHLTWTATALGALFDYYEIQRQDQYGTWATVATIDIEATVEWFDFDARLGLTSSYRIRAVTVAGVYGSWSATVNATAPVSGTGLTFTSNANPAGNIAYSDIYSDTAERMWRNDEAAELVTQKLAGRDFVVAFQGCERRGLSFEALLLVNALGAPSVVGIHAFDALRNLAKSPVPAICVRNHEGDRWYVAMTVPEVHIREGDHWYTAPITCVEVMGNPPPVAA